MNRIITKKILPGYVHPEENELLSSWIFRLSQAHKIKPYSFTKFYFNESVFWTRDVDKFLYQAVIVKLAEITPHSIEDILNLHLISYQDLIFNTPLQVSFTQGITRLGIYHRKRKNNGLLACPKCLEKKGYYRKSWRLLTTLICSDCNCNMIDHCPNCKSPIIFQRLEIGDKSNFREVPIFLCWKCNYDLRTSYELVQEALLQDYQKYIDSCIKNGYAEQSQYSFLYLQVLLNIFNSSKTRSSKWTRVRNAFISEFGIDNEEFNVTSLETSINFRRKLLPLIFALLNDIPGRFVPFCKKYHLRYYDFGKDKGELPFWFSKIFKEYY